MTTTYQDQLNGDTPSQEVSQTQIENPTQDVEMEETPNPTSSVPEEKIAEESSNGTQGVEYIYDINQTGEVVTGPGARSNSIAGILGGTLPKLSSDQSDSVNKAKKYAMEQSIRMVLMKQTLAHQQQKNRTFQRHQVLNLMCRVYVGSISFELKEDTIRQSFLPFGPIKSINMSWDPVTQKHKGFAFVEYEIPEAAHLALEQMNGVMIGGRNIKVVGRPSNMPQAQTVIDEIQEEAKLYNRIYVSSIHPDLTEDDIKSVFEAFGPITFCKLAQGSTGHKHKGYGFIEYETLQAANEAISSMNLFDLGGQYLRVGRAITPPNRALGPSAGAGAMPTAAAVAAAAATAKIQAMDAVASNAVALGLKLNPPAVTTAIPAVVPPPGIAIPTVPGVPAALPGVAIPTVPNATIGPPVIAVPTIGAPGVAVPTIATPVAAVSGVVTPAVVPVIPPPGVAIPQFPNVIQPTIVTPVVSTIPQAIIPPPTVVTLAPPTMPITTPAQDALKRAQEAQLKQQEELQKKLLDQNEPQTLQQQENMSIKGQNARHLVMQKLMRKVDSRVVILRNMVGPDEVDETLEEEIQEECSKYGAVERVVVYNEQQSEGDEDDVIVKIFVEFLATKEAEAARDALNGRYFGGRMVRASLYDQTLYDHSDFSG
ncbi:poly(U)-binding-splicing factor half pint isoform X2 [Coccinella septempunctata]|uniref:poly(U)-binding-splicing factor half pint isoform X2 n=1 Tax=Coccinella septempunctata TaxID=41139 RepID=UPI001D05C6B6|nr:poly(U)-binding-splicing factor half pint isoform X2 [Coccinella septempunctata]